MQRLSHLITTTVFALATGACNVALEGANGVFSFEPTNCGYLSDCDFEDNIAVGGTVSVRLHATGDMGTAGINLASDDPSVIMVTPSSDSRGEASWDIVATGPGVARLVALRPDFGAYNGDQPSGAEATEVDFIEVSVVEPSGVGFVYHGSVAEGPFDSDIADERWIVPENESVSFTIVAVQGGRVPAMGRFHWNVSHESQVQRTSSDNQTELGLPIFNVPKGSHVIDVYAINESWLDGSIELSTGL